MPTCNLITDSVRISATVNVVRILLVNLCHFATNSRHGSLINRKRAARTVLTGMCYSVGSATRQGEQFADPVYRP
ncbi:hypothetical protein QZK93_22475, partial [Escherichia coli]|nr:hypothetical protein [Escherichia coli]